MGTVLESIDYILKNFENLRDIDESSIEKICNLILSSQNIFVYGVGRSGIIGRTFSMRLVQLGLKAYFVGETVTPVVTSRDIVILISGTGETQGTLLVAQISKKVNARVISITAEKDSSLYRMGDYNILLKTNSPSDLAPLGTLFELSTLVLLDAMVALLMEMKGEHEDDMRKRHAIWV
ncbi:MAG: SIS domain-containing protein [Thermoplasmata archaeon]